VSLLTTYQIVSFCSAFFYHFLKIVFGEVYSALLMARRYHWEADSPSFFAARSAWSFTDAGRRKATRASRASPSFRAFFLPVLPCGLLTYYTVFVALIPSAKPRVRREGPARAWGRTRRRTGGRGSNTRSAVPSGASRASALRCISDLSTASGTTYVSTSSGREADGERRLVLIVALAPKPR